jgi:type II secretory pathway pseudopilin PulG
MASLNKQLRGYILLESILAMIIVMVCFGVAMLIYNNIITGMRGRLELQARLLLEQEALNAYTADRLVDEWGKNDVIDIEKSITPYTSCENVYVLQLTARDHDQRILATHNELIYKP